MKRLTALVIALVMVLVACGGGSDDALLDETAQDKLETVWEVFQDVGRINFTLDENGNIIAFGVPAAFSQILEETGVEERGDCFIYPGGDDRIWAIEFGSFDVQYGVFPDGLSMFASCTSSHEGIWSTVGWPEV